MWSDERCAFMRRCCNSEQNWHKQNPTLVNKYYGNSRTCSCFMFLQQEMSNKNSGRLEAIDNSKIILDQMKHVDSIRVHGFHGTSCILHLCPHNSTWILGMPPALVRLILNLNRDNAATALQSTASCPTFTWKIMNVMMLLLPKCLNALCMQYVSMQMWSWMYVYQSSSKQSYAAFSAFSLCIELIANPLGSWPQRGRGPNLHAELWSAEASGHQCLRKRWWKYMQMK